ncbi:hypothetical protein NKH77_07765 [Streptomyces sp. M19]
MVALLGVLKAGAAAVPVDVGHPRPGWSSCWSTPRRRCCWPPRRCWSGSAGAGRGRW